MGLLGTVLHLITSSTNVCFSAFCMPLLSCTYDLYWMLEGEFCVSVLISTELLIANRNVRVFIVA